ncbi:MAG: hypothetical protein IPM85_17185 [Chitinophagaceae bacterium]|nr:hypothetical protein [Chitinophagaceae bacterium]
MDQYRDKIITSLRKSAPADRLWELGKPADLFSYCRQNEVPSNTGLYVSYQLARQEFLLRSLEQLLYNNPAAALQSKKAVWEKYSPVCFGKKNHHAGYFRL